MRYFEWEDSHFCERAQQTATNGSSSSFPNPTRPTRPFSSQSALQYIMTPFSELIARSFTRRSLESSDDFVRLKSAAIISTILPYDSSPPSSVVEQVSRALSSMIRESAPQTRLWTAVDRTGELTGKGRGSRTGSPNEPEAQDVGVQCFESVLRVSKARQYAWRAEETDSENGENKQEAAPSAGDEQQQTAPKIVEA